MKTILSKVKSRFTSYKQHPQPRYIYAVTAGALLGELLVFMNTTGNDHNFLTIPNMSPRRIPVDKFKLGIKDKIVDVVEKLPTFVYDVCKLQYIKNDPSNAVATD